jgi:hypothetical protein
MFIKREVGLYSRVVALSVPVDGNRKKIKTTDFVNHGTLTYINMTLPALERDSELK